MIVARGRLKRIIQDPSRILLYIIHKKNRCFWWMSDENYIKMEYRLTMKKKLDLDNPTSFNEKMQWLKLYDRNPRYTVMVDKYLAKQYVAKKIGEEYIIPTIEVWDKPEDIDFEMLPDQFVLKVTHDSGGLVICKDKSKLDKNGALEKIRRSWNNDYYKVHREWPYKNVPRKIIAEQYMTDQSNIELNDWNASIKTHELTDYKFMCFDGKVKCSFVGSERYSESGLKVTFFDRDWNMLPFERHYPKSKVPILKPKNYEKMIELAEQLSKGISFVRVDFYEISGKIFFGELTFFPGSGFEEFTPTEWDNTLGSWITLPKK